MQARYSGDRQLMAFVAGFRRYAGHNLGDGPIRYDHLHVVGPARWKQC